MNGTSPAPGVVRASVRVSLAASESPRPKKASWFGTSGRVRFRYGENLKTVVAVLCVMPVGMAVMDSEAILEAVDTAAILIVTVIHLQMLGL